MSANGACCIDLGEAWVGEPASLNMHIPTQPPYKPTFSCTDATGEDLVSLLYEVFAFIEVSKKLSPLVFMSVLSHVLCYA